MVRINLKRLLDSRKMTQSELASAAGIRPSTICDYCHNTAVSIKLEHIDRICAVLGCNVGELICYSTSSVPPHQSGGKRNEGIKSF